MVEDVNGHACQVIREGQRGDIQVFVHDDAWGMRLRGTRDATPLTRAARFAAPFPNESRWLLSAGAWYVPLVTPRSDAVGAPSWAPSPNDGQRASRYELRVPVCLQYFV